MLGSVCLRESSLIGVAAHLHAGVVLLNSYYGFIMEIHL
jgi:hypothetical protein